MIKLNENIIRWIIAVPCILLTVCLVPIPGISSFGIGQGASCSVSGGIPG